MELLEIKPKEGLNILKFGMNMQQVEEHIGPAEEVEHMGHDEDFPVIIWHYWDKGYSLFFEVNEKQAFTSVEVDNENALLWGNRIFSLSEGDIIQMFKSKGFHMWETEDQDWGEKRISFDEAMIDFYFEENRLTAVNYGVFNHETHMFIFPN